MYSCENENASVYMSLHMCVFVCTFVSRMLWKVCMYEERVDSEQR